jgi:hypothetical protein
MKRFVPVLLSLALLATAGCQWFTSKKKTPKPPKDTPNVAQDVEKDFMHRWLDKRTAELEAQGLNADAAHARAVAEFKATYAYTGVAQQAK